MFRNIFVILSVIFLSAYYCALRTMISHARYYNWYYFEDETSYVVTEWQFNKLKNELRSPTPSPMKIELGIPSTVPFYVLGVVVGSVGDTIMIGVDAITPN
jgi:hypothetical protein